MKTNRRWLKSVIAASSASLPAMPWQTRTGSLPEFHLMPRQGILKTVAAR